MGHPCTPGTHRHTPSHPRTHPHMPAPEGRECPFCWERARGASAGHTPRRNWAPSLLAPPCHPSIEFHRRSWPTPPRPQLFFVTVAAGDAPTCTQLQLRLHGFVTASSSPTAFPTVVNRVSRNTLWPSSPSSAGLTPTLRVLGSNIPTQPPPPPYTHVHMRLCAQV